MGEIYLDWNATTPPYPEVLEAMRQAAGEGWGNPSSVHAAGRRARALIEAAREELAELLTVHPRDVLFTSGGTEANNLALRHAAALITSRLEHPSVIRVAEALTDEGRCVCWLEVGSSGELDVEALEAYLDAGSREAVVVAVALANHETGVLQDIEALGQLTTRFGAWLHSDIVQAFGKLDATAWRGADSVAVAAHKLRGPKGVGALAWRSGAGPRPVLLGGAQQRGLRPGTEDVVGIAGFRAAWRQRRSWQQTEMERVGALRDHLEAALMSLGAQVNGGEARRLPHVSNVSVPGWRGDELVAALDLRGICVSSGSACSAGTIERSPVIEAMLGTGRAESALRISLGLTTTRGEVETLLRVMAELSAGSA